MASYEELQRRKKLNEALLAQSLQQDPSQFVSGRTVPYSPIQGISKIVQALMARKGIEGAETGLETGRKEAMGNVMDLYRGRAGVAGQPAMPGQPQMGGPLALGEGEQYQPFQPETMAQPAVEAIPAIEADPEAAILQAASSPYTKDMASVMAAFQKAKGAGTGTPYSTIQHITRADGTTVPVVVDHRTKEITNLDGTPFTATGTEVGPTSPQYTPEVKGAIKGAEEKAKLAEQLKTKPQIERDVAIQKAVGAAEGAARVQLPATEVAAAGTLALVDELLEHPGFKDAVGFWDNPAVLGGYMPGTEAAGFRERLKQLQGRTFMDIFPTLKGGGQITEIEGEKGQMSINRMATATNEREFKDAAADFKSEIERLRNIVRKRAGEKPIEQPVQKAMENVIRFNSRGEMIE